MDLGAPTKENTHTPLIASTDARMIDHSPPDQTSDICLLLRAHAEQHWLIYELVPVVRELEQRDSAPDEDLAAALAYVEALWIEARMRAFETDAASAALRSPGSCPDL